jgi:hypothetical protein
MEVRMTRRLCLVCPALAAASAMGPLSARQTAFRTVNDRFPPPRLTTLEAWKARAEYLREHVLASTGLLPLPDKTPLRPSPSGR